MLKCKISDKSDTFSLNYSNLFRGPLFSGHSVRVELCDAPSLLVQGALPTLSLFVYFSYNCKNNWYKTSWSKPNERTVSHGKFKTGEEMAVYGALCSMKSCFLPFLHISFVMRRCSILLVVELHILCAADVGKPLVQPGPVLRLPVDHSAADRSDLHLLSRPVAVH